MWLSKEELNQFEKQDFGSGANGVYYLDRKKQLLLKTFKTLYRIEEREQAIDYLLLFPSVVNSGYPVEPLFIDEEFEGYVTSFFEKSIPFDSSATKNFTFLERINAIQDVSSQLREVHKRDIIFNDMNSSNQLISHQGGHLIDFEDIWLPKQFNTPRVKYLLTFQDNELSATKKVDQFKQYISNLSLLYQVNLEKYYQSLGFIENMPALFSFNKDISDFLKEQLDCLIDPTISLLEYIDVLLPVLMDEEKICFERENLKQQVLLKH